MKRKLSRVLAGSVFVVLILTAIYAIMSKREQYIAGETNKKMFSINIQLQAINCRQ